MMKNILEYSGPKFKISHWKPSAPKEYISSENWWGMAQHMDTQGQATDKQKKYWNFKRLVTRIASTEVHDEPTIIHELAQVSFLQIKNTP